MGANHKKVPLPPRTSPFYMMALHNEAAKKMEREYMNNPPTKATLMKQVEKLRKEKRQRKQKPKPVEEVLFTRDSGRRVPVRVQDASDLWLDMFMSFSGMIVPEHGEKYDFKLDHQRGWLDAAAYLADHGLELYESRWPHMSHDPLPKD